MLDKDLKKYFSNPILGLFPFLVYLTVYYFTGNTVSGLLACFGLSILFDVAIRFYTKSSACGLMFEVTLVATVLTILVKTLLENNVYSEDVYPVFFEIFLVFILLTIRLFRPYLIGLLFPKKNPIEKVFLNEFFYVAGIVQYFFTLHIFSLLIVKYIEGVPSSLNSYLYTWVPIMVILFLMFFQGIKIRRFAEKLQNEKWLPIVNEKGQVSGRIAYSESKKLGNKFMHPVLRIALICDNKIYLQERDAKDDINPSSLDHPFESLILFNEDINLAARKKLASLLGDNANVRLNFSFKYVFKNDKTQRLVFLFIANILKESDLDVSAHLRGKFWSVKQIEDNFVQDNIFSECYMMEHEYLKNTLETLSLTTEYVSPN